MIAAITGLLLCQLLGEVLVRALALPLPGPVAGMGLMLAALAWRGRLADRSAPAFEPVPHHLGLVADALLRNLSLLFIPAAVGIVQYLDLLRQYGWAIVLSIAVSTTAALLATVVAFRLCARAQTRFRGAEGHGPGNAAER